MDLSEAKLPSSKRRGVYWVIAILGTATVMYIPTFRFFWTSWMADAQYSLAYLVPFVSGYFIWKKWPEVAKLERRPCVWGAVLIGFALAFHLLGVILDVSGPSGVSVLLCIVGGCLYLHSAALVRTLAFPLAYTVFMIPVPGGILDLIGFPLQLLATGGTAFLLRLIGMEVTQSGVSLAVPGYDFQVAMACSGMSSLVALIGVTAVFAYITRLPVGLKWVLFLLAVPIALAANMVRITTIALVGYQWGPEVAGDMYHDWSSPILFLAAIGILFLVNGVLEWASGRRTTS